MVRQPLLMLWIIGFSSGLKANITIQVCVSAASQLLPPYIIYTGKHLMPNCTNGGPLGTCYAVSLNGWMTTSAYIDWFCNMFLPSLPDRSDSYLTFLSPSSSFQSSTCTPQTSQPFVSACTTPRVQYALVSSPSSTLRVLLPPTSLSVPESSGTAPKSSCTSFRLLLLQ